MNPPPWTTDPDSALYWVPLPYAARVYFRKSRARLHQMRIDGTLAEAGIPTWFDGSRWYCRLPVILTKDCVQSV